MLIHSFSPQSAKDIIKNVNDVEGLIFRFDYPYEHICVMCNILLNLILMNAVQIRESKESWLSTLLLLCPQAALPSVPPDTKLSKLDVLVLATNYIAYLTETLDQGGVLAEHTLPSRPGGYLHPVKVQIGTNNLLLIILSAWYWLLFIQNMACWINISLISK